MSNLSRGAISRKVGQSPGSCSLVQPNTGHCRGLSYTGLHSPSVAGVPPPISEAALAALLAALPFFFPLGIVVVVPFSGLPPGCRAADASEDFTAAASLDLGGVDWVILLASGGPSGSVESVPWLSLPSSDIASDPAWRPPTDPTAERGRPREVSARRRGRRLEDSFSQCQLHYPFQLRVVCRLAVCQIEVACLLAVLVWATHTQ
jgi:hypothetical protein